MRGLFSKGLLLLIMLAGVCGNRGMSEGGAYAKEQWEFFDWPAPPVLKLCSDLNRVEDWEKPLAAGDELRFHTVGVGQPADVLLKPFHGGHHERYTISTGIVAAEHLAVARSMRNRPEQTGVHTLLCRAFRLTPAQGYALEGNAARGGTTAFLRCGDQRAAA